MALTALGVHELAERVLACVCQALDATAEEVTGHPGCPCRACVVPGAPAWDSCEDPCDNSGGPGGQLTVHVARIFPSREFPAPDQTVLGLRGCTPPSTTAAELVVTLLRCAPAPTEHGCPPSCEELAATARIVHVDAATVFNALMCCLPSTGGWRGRRFVMGEQRIVGPQGGCVGVEQRVIVALPGCGPCPGASS
ncbi:hypothetical protein E1211_25895 [Micromonospora sp. 15K316]|uniref:hypothetical protein n=1 Tax=Micromonospora sp. 15K316 TaxID=2530376 RepID=UPI00104E2E85|nr:hypothetical protein [Micromonospora sp. 15K316]TDC29494.1 hypothetical protein E1211_25895 [Micromonospora sp. 15K316]